MRPTPVAARELQPVKKLGKAAGSCGVQARVYGDCILHSYQNVEQGMCAREFQAFKLCVQKAMGRKW